MTNLYKKKVLFSLAATALLATTILPTVSHAEESSSDNQVIQNADSTQAELTLGTLNSEYQMTGSTMQGVIRTITYQKDEEKHIVVLNGENGSVTIDNIVQTDLSFEYNPEEAMTRQMESVNGNEEQSSPSSIMLKAAAPKKGYHYMGTMSGNTKTAKNAAVLAVALAGTIPGIGWSGAAVAVLTGYGLNERIPELYYTYDLYDKGFMTDQWYQYTTTRFYKDKKHKKPTGKAWTSKPQYYPLPNS